MITNNRKKRAEEKEIIASVKATFLFFGARTGTITD